MSKIKFNPLSGDLEFATNEIHLSEALVTDNLLVGAGDNEVKPLANGEEGQVIVMSGGKPQWKPLVSDTNIGYVEELPEATREEGKVISYRGKVYVFHGGQWVSHAEIADNLGGKPEVHEENFVYQPTAADLSIKDGIADIKKLKGNTVVWNQMFDYSNIVNNNLATYDNSTGIFTCTPVNQSFILKTNNLAKKNHYHLISCEIKSDNNAIINVWNGTTTPVLISATSNWKKTISIIKCTDGTRSLGVSSNDGVNPFEVKNIKAFDLTQMFGEGNEPTIEEFEAMFPNDYYEYNEGELMSFDGKGIKTVGFNQWDEVWVTGAYDINNGIKIQQDTHLRNVNPIKVFGSTDYYFKSPTRLFLCWYDSEMKFINPDNTNYVANNIIVKSPSNAAYLNFYQYNKNTYNNDICINLSHSGYRNGEYEPYKSHTTLLSDNKTISQLTGKLNGEGDSVTIFPDGLRSAGNVFDEITPDGKAIKRIGVVNMGDLSWTMQDGRYWARIEDIAGQGYDSNIICARYIRASNSNNFVDKTITGLGLYYTDNIIVKDSSYADAASFKASLQGQILYYELATPAVYELDFFTNTSYEAYDFGTEQVLYNDDNEVNIPIKANIKYGFNAVDIIRNNYFNFQKLKDDFQKLKDDFQKLNAIVSDIVRSNEPTS